MWTVRSIHGSARADSLAGAMRIARNRWIWTGLYFVDVDGKTLYVLTDGSEVKVRGGIVTVIL